MKDENKDMSSEDKEVKEEKKSAEIDNNKERKALYKVFDKEKGWNNFFRKKKEEDLSEEEYAFKKGCDYGSFIGMIIGTIFGIFLISVLNLKSFVSPLENIDEITKKLNEINFYINKYSLYEKDNEKISDMISLGMMAGLDDKYAYYYSKDAVSKLQVDITGEYVGIGVLAVEDPADGYLVISKIYDESNAKYSGLEVGDKIIRVDDNELYNLDSDSVVAMIKGKAGTIVKLTVLKENGKEAEYSIERKKIEVPQTTGKMLENGIGYITIDSFEGKAYSQFLEYQNSFIKQGVKGLIIDLRNNPGGNLNVLQELSNIFLDNKLITYFEDKYGAREEYSTKPGMWDIPLVILVNEYSASASEAFTGAMQDYGRATVIGTKTFGKGVVQEIYSLVDGSAIKFTMSKYYTPLGRNFDGEGIVPDVEIEDIETTTKDEQLEKAIEVLKTKFN